MGADLARLAVLALLHVLAFPTRVVLWAIRARRARAAFGRIAGGSLRCEFCREVNELDILARCGRCSFVAYGNRLWCPNCQFVARGFSCDHCQATIVVFRE